MRAEPRGPQSPSHTVDTCESVVVQVTPDGTRYITEGPSTLGRLAILGTPEETNKPRRGVDEAVLLRGQAL